MKAFLSTNPGKATIVSLVAIMIGGVAWACTLALGLKQTANISNVFDWGILISLFAFLVGIGAGCQIVASYLYVTGRGPGKKLIMILQALAVGGAVGAGLAVTLDLGSPFHLGAMILTPNLTSLLFWDMVGLVVFIVLGIASFFAMAKEWRYAKPIVVAAELAAIGLQVIEGLLFATQSARVWWASPVTIVDFLVVAAICGMAVALVAACVLRISAAGSFAAPLVIAIVIHSVLSLLEVTLLVMNPDPLHTFAADSLFTVLPLYLVELVLPLGAGLVLLLPGRRGDKDKGDKVGLTCAIVALVGMFAHRLMLLYPAFLKPVLSLGFFDEYEPRWLYPLSAGRYDVVDIPFAIEDFYVPAVPELMGAFLPLGVAALVVIAGIVLAERMMEPSAPGAPSEAPPVDA